MFGKQRIFTIAAILAMLSPAATATWMAYGTFEPDTPQYDGTGAYMFTDPSVDGVKRLYFNAWATQGATLLTGVVNPNVGALRTQNEVAHSEFHYAILGYWTDCNGDGYVGMAESSLREYASELLLDTSVCAPSSGPMHTWNGEHNYNGWVVEFIAVGRDTNTNDDGTQTDARIVVDDEARVWGDFGRPDFKPTQRSCTLAPQARGTYQSTGGFINWVDCRVDIIGASNQVNGAIGDPLGLRFSDTDDATVGGNPLHRETLGTEDSSRSAVHYSDCDGSETVNTTQPVDDTGLEQQLSAATGRNVNAPNFVVPTFNPRAGDGDPANWNVPGTMNATREEADFLIFASGDCDYTNDNGGDTYEGTCQVTGCGPGVGEADFNGVNPNKKNEADWNFDYDGFSRGIFDARGLEEETGPLPDESIPLNGDSGAPPDFGANPGGVPSHIFLNPVWSSDSNWLSKPGFGIVKADLSSGGVGIAEAYYLTFYAYVGENTTSAGIQVPGSGIYGSWHCGSETTGIHNGFVCDPSLWYLSPNGAPIPDPDNILARPGQPYVARDVDCADGGNSLGVGMQPASFGSSPCQ